MAGKVILLNGASSSGKSTIAQALQGVLPEPFWHWSIDKIREAGVLPLARYRSGEFRWVADREAFFESFHRSLPAFAGAGANLIVEHIVETAAWHERLQALLTGVDVFLVGVHCPLAELERRERARGDRPASDAARDFATCHQGLAYDLEVDATLPPERNALTIAGAWQARTSPSAFARMRG
jgi:chloramphenicol 3-O phosphotransferase